MAQNGYEEAKLNLEVSRLSRWPVCHRNGPCFDTCYSNSL